MASKFLMPPLTVGKRQMASMAARKASAAPIHQLEVSQLGLTKIELFLTDSFVFRLLCCQVV